MFASRVLPGALLVRARRRRTSALIKLDLPTFERPKRAISANLSRGKPDDVAAVVATSAAIFTPRADPFFRHSHCLAPSRSFAPQAFFTARALALARAAGASHAPHRLRVEARPASE